MKKTLLPIAILILTLSLCLIFAACTSKDTPSDTHPAATTAEETQNPNADSSAAVETDTETESPFPDETAAVSGLGLEGRETVSGINIHLLTEKTDGNTATVKTPTGLTYTAGGYAKFENEKFTFTDTLTLTLESGAFSENFNRFRMQYTSSAPVKFTLTFEQDGAEKSDYYFAEAGTDMFCGLIFDYIDSKTAYNLKSITVVPCESSKSVEFALCGLDTQTIEVYRASTIRYVEGKNFKLGYSLKFGGSICYIEDKNCTIKGVKNMINMHDAGRLVQQSYYGTRKTDTYDPGAVGFEEWMYNPVQGGDNKAYSSRIIDIIESDSEVYIKVQPLDWGAKQQYTPSYMENVYTIRDDYIRVDNRFVDFMGVEHPLSSQELPAFYTINYFDEFVCYSGDQSWTDAPLYRNDDIEFKWTANEHTYPISVYMRQNNTETWCALVSTADNYGIGMYVPNTDRLAGGDYEPNKSKECKDNSCSYMSAACHIQMTSYEPIVYSYLVTTGSVEQIRAIFKQNKDFTDNATLANHRTSVRIAGSNIDITDIDFTNPDAAVVFSEERLMSYEYDETEKAFKLTSVPGEKEPDPYFYVNYTKFDEKYNAEDFGTITIEYMVPAETSQLTRAGCEFFLCAGDTAYAEGGKAYKVTSLICDGEYHTLEVDISGLPFWKGQINQIRFDFFNCSQAGDVMYLKSFKIS